LDFGITGTEEPELLAFKLTPANVDDREPVPDMTKDLIGKLFGDRGYSLFQANEVQMV
jgi:hypothetical protein